MPTNSPRLPARHIGEIAYKPRAIYDGARESIAREIIDGSTELRASDDREFMAAVCPAVPEQVTMIRRDRALVELTRSRAHIMRADHALDAAQSILSDGKRLQRLQTRDDQNAARHTRIARVSVDLDTAETCDVATKRAHVQGREIASDVRPIPVSALNARAATVDGSPRAFTFADLKRPLTAFAICEDSDDLLLSDSGHVQTGHDVVSEWARGASEALTPTRDHARVIAASLVARIAVAPSHDYPLIVQDFAWAAIHIFDRRLASRTEENLYAALNSTNAKRRLAKAFKTLRA